MTAGVFPGEEPSNITDTVAPDAFGYTATLAPEPGADDEGPQLSAVARVFLVILQCTLFILMVMFPLLLIRRRWRRNVPEIPSEHVLGQSGGEAFTSLQDLAAKKSARYDIIESWLVSKVVHEHDENCDKLVVQMGGESALDKYDEKTDKSRRRTGSVGTLSTDMVDEEWGSSSSSGDDGDSEAGASRECLICMEEMQVGDIVSWSANRNCVHIFHHGCIKQWLLKRTCCPVCREIFLPVDQYRGKLTLKQINELILAKKERMRHCYYCLRDGVMYLPKDTDTLLKDPDVLQAIEQRAAAEPEKSELTPSRDSSLLIHGQFCLPIVNDESVHRYSSHGAINRSENSTHEGQQEGRIEDDLESALGATEDTVPANDDLESVTDGM